MITESLVELINEAERRGLWLRTPLYDLWFSPRQMRAENEAGRFCWDAENFSLGDPATVLADLAEAIKSLEERRDRIQKEMAAMAEGSPMELVRQGKGYLG